MGDLLSAMDRAESWQTSQRFKMAADVGTEPAFDDLGVEVYSFSLTDTE